MKKYPLGNYGLAYALTILWIGSMVGHFISAWKMFVNDSADHNQKATYGDFAWEFTRQTLENWQSEFLQLLTITLLGVFLIMKGAPESRDGNDKLENMLKDIQTRLDKLEL